LPQVGRIEIANPRRRVGWSQSIRERNKACHCVMVSRSVPPVSQNRPNDENGETRSPDPLAFGGVACPGLVANQLVLTWNMNPRRLRRSAWIRVTWYPFNNEVRSDCKEAVQARRARGHFRSLLPPDSAEWLVCWAYQLLPPDAHRKEQLVLDGGARGNC